MLAKITMLLRIGRKKYSILILTLIVSIVIILMNVNYFRTQYLSLSHNWTSLAKISRYSHYSVIKRHNISLKEIIKANIKSDLDNSIVEDMNKKKEKLIVLWTQFFGQSNYVYSEYLNGCLHKNCIFSSNRSLLKESDAVMFHLRDTDVKDLPKYRRSDQRWILLNHESPENTPHILDRLDGLINWTVTYRYGSDIFLSPKFVPRDEPNIDYNPNRNYAQNKSRMIVWLASNCKTASNRERYVEELKKTVTVDVYGHCGDKQCLPKMSAECLTKLSKEYRFILAFENSICKDYVTEKYFNSLAYDIIPVVFGGFDYNRIVPKKSFIDALTYPSPRQLARYLIYLTKHQNQYNSYFKWKNNYKLTAESYPCEICNKLNNPSEPMKVWHNLNAWWFDADCRTWSPSTLY